MKTRVYVDGFNFYYGCVKDTAFKWLDFDAFCRASMPNDAIDHIRYFTALVKPDRDPQQSVRQATYLRALATFPSITIHTGQFLKVQKRGVILLPAPQRGTIATINAWEEKGTDVNVASYLLSDAFQGKFEQAVVISNDSDLVAPIEIIRGELQLPVRVLSPHKSTGRPSYHLQQVASSFHKIDRSLFASCQLPATIMDANGKTITKPAAW